MMMTEKILIFLVVTVSLCCRAYGQDIWIKNTNVIDVENGQVKENMDILIKDGLIFEISDHQTQEKKPDNVEVIDGSGKYLLPGFVDTHVHMAMGEVEVSVVDGQPTIGMNLEDELPEITASLLLKHGITTSRDPGGFTEVTVQVKENIASGKMMGPELFVAGSILDTTQFTNLVAQVKSKSEVVEEVRKQKASGVDFIKFYTSLPPELLEAGIREAHKIELETIAHLHNTSWTEASRLGIDNIVHIIPVSDIYIPDEHKASYHQSVLMGSKAFYKWFEYVDLESEKISELISTLKKNNTSVDPTLVVFHATFFGNTSAYKTHELLSELPDKMIENWQTIFNFNLGWTEQDFIDAQKIWPKVQRFVKMLHDQGIMLTTGTDTNNPWIIPGGSFHRELQLLTGCGLTNAEILKMATLNGAKLLKVEDRIGTIEKGKEADLVLLSSNPLLDIQNVKDIAMIISNGVKVELK
ncbi:imidazolonepropionase-like amidohydrolase [Catalinimonas alkaloidigena]|uniref:amidohydrolase family protein n=1 Tax=Catalinimonas alkaloidigena TaxID=1075417 RepID=UPI00240732AE|nr:amidohydrolase family protein [Catalinimonas alkaloidigena]MDF9801335.1 imidazolonepropionase-like amidohydrolase [Catalinimonas alkaloidigena]